MKIKIKYHKNSKKLEQHGNRIDLFSRYNYWLEAPKLKVNLEGIQEVVFDFNLIDLGISMVIPKHFEAIISPRSSTYKKFGLIQANSIGIIDGGTIPTKGIDSSDKVYKGYTGQEDIWMFPAISFKKINIVKNEAICQFTIQPSMNAPIWTKLKWLFNKSIEFVEVDILHNVNRGSSGTSSTAL